MVRSVLERGGHYVLLCAHPYARQAIERRRRAIHEALQEVGFTIPWERISFCDADKIALWANAHPSVALWVQETLRLASPGRFASWHQWRSRSEHSVPWVDDPRLPELRSAIRERFARISAGFPAIPVRIGGEAGATQLVDPRPDQLIDNFVVGKAQRDLDVLLRSATLLSAFRLVRVDPVDTGWRDSSQVQTTEDCLAPIAALGRRLTWKDLYAATQRLAQRGVFKRRGGLGAVQPRPIAIRLAERQWKDWDPGKWDEVLSGGLGLGLTRVAAERLAHLNGTEIAKRVVKHVCREGGPLDNGTIDEDRAEVLVCMAEVDAKVVAAYIDRLLDRSPDPPRLGGNVRNSLLRALGRIAFPAATFAVGARLMLRVLEVGGGTDGEHLARPFTTLYPAMAGATEADGNRRLRFLDEVSATRDGIRMSHVVRALAAGCEPVSHSSAIGPDVQGSRRTLNRWHPATTNELAEYVGGCISRLSELASRNDDVGVMCREKLGGSVAGLVHHGFIHPVEEAIRRVAGAGHRWTLALRQLHGVLVHFPGSVDEATTSRVQSLIDLLTPTNLYDRVRALVTEPAMPRDWATESASEHMAAVHAKIDALTDELPTDAGDIARTPPEAEPGQARPRHRTGGVNRQRSTVRARLAGSDC